MLPLAGAVLPARAQTTRATNTLLLVPTAQAELALRNGDYVLLNVGTSQFTNQNSLNQSFAAVSYEHFWGPKWSWGGRVLRYGGGSSALVPEVLLRHRAALGPLTFGQRLSVERRFYTGISSRDYDQNWVRLRLDLEKIIPLGGADATTGLALRPRLSFEAATHLRLQKEAADPSERFIQTTALRAEVGVRTGPSFDLTPWFAYGADYLVTLPQYDSMGKQTAGGNLNVRTPLLGLDVRYTFGAGRGVAGRQQLPTQH
ncbi:hypothetical protein [Hymenobacter sp. PAMC 26628]|uniref:hypothetical protein n=1 Tax=Hymenobacter sp. PAMC 26628 TaxID=1484118 RepID=UPI0007700A16|nr:hypothetical protein [Hymenobacter sp. PAMC 26628]AMJ67046.1 hypothetical protein AXW84_17630 [Hymenobacter sp. PAMC 26628]